jgi:hypothetical protein
MTQPIVRQLLIELLRGEEDLLEQLVDAGLVPRDESALLPEHAETARVVDTLVHELEVNWPGVEVVLHVRSQLLATRQQIHDLLTLLDQRSE